MALRNGIGREGTNYSVDLSVVFGQHPDFGSSLAQNNLPAHQLSPFVLKNLVGLIFLGCTTAAQYFDFGRYGGKYGDVRGPYPVGTMSFDKDGMPTMESMEAIKQTLSERFGKGNYPNSVYNRDADAAKIIAFALDRQKNVDKYPYSINPFGKHKFNVCDTFAIDALEAGLK